MNIYICICKNKQHYNFTRDYAFYPADVKIQKRSSYIRFYNSDNV